MIVSEELPEDVVDKVRELRTTLARHDMAFATAIVGRADGQMMLLLDPEVPRSMQLQILESVQRTVRARIKQISD